VNRLNAAHPTTVCQRILQTIGPTGRRPSRRSSTRATALRAAPARPTMPARP
jgi:hypothetical protein